MIDTSPITSPAHPDQPFRGDIEHAALYGHQFLDGDHLEIQDVDQDVDHRDRAGAERQGERQVATWIVHLFRHIRRGIPPGVDEHHDDQPQQPARSSDGAR